MDKQKQIEEMAKVIHHTEFVDISGYEEEKIAEELLKHYQPKLPENAVVLTRKDREEFNELYRSALQRAEKWEKLCGIKIKEARKETAKEIFEKVLSYIGSNQKFCIVDNDNQTLIDCDKLWEFVGILAKQFGVEVEE